jgi:hypothetical protein
MPIDTQPKRRGPTSEQVVAEQKRQAAVLAEQKRQAAVLAEQKRQGAAQTNNVPAKVANSIPAPTIIDNRTPEQRYIDEIAPTQIAGQLVKFSKEGKFVIAETDEEISPDIDFVVLADETFVGWVKFNPDGKTPPERVMGLLYDGFVMPARETLGDLDQTEWPIGLSGVPEDPWRHQICLVLQNPQTEAYFTFATTSLTGRRACGNLLRHYDRMQRRGQDDYPVVRLKPSGFQHKTKSIGWVATPSFVVVGRTPKTSAAVPDSSIAADMNDSIPI